jgi:ZIP family zinc transporter
MNELFIILFFSWIAGFAAFIGGLFAFLEDHAEDGDKKDALLHSIMAFSGGVLISAVAFTLAPTAIDALSHGQLVTSFCAGGIVFCVMDMLIEKYNKSEDQFIAMLTDFIPEVLALGAVFTSNPKLGILLALFIGLQNLPEGFNSFTEVMKAEQSSAGKVFRTFFAVSLLGPLAAGIGYFFFQNHDILTGQIMSFAGGGILYVVFQDIAPISTMQKHKTLSLGAVMGFVLGMLAKQYLLV